MIAIFGSARDGSTLLMRLLDGASGIWMYPIELKFFNQLMGSHELALRRLLPRTTPRSQLGATSLEAFARFQLGQLEQQYASQAEDRVTVGEAALTAPGPTVGFGEGLAWFLRRAAAACGADPANELAFKTTEAREKQLYEAVLPGLRAIHIVRHPLDQFESTKRTVAERPGFLYWYLDDASVLERFVQRWRAHCGHALRAVARDPQRNILVRYEDLTRDPVDEVGRVVAWLGVAMPTEPAVQTIFGGKRLARLPDNPSKAGVETPQAVVRDMHTVYGYEPAATPFERVRVVEATADLMRDLGYGGEAAA